MGRIFPSPICGSRMLVDATLPYIHINQSFGVALRVGAADHWKRRIAEWMLNWKIEFEKVSSVYRKVYPDFEGYLYLAIIDSLIELIDSYYEEPNIEKKKIFTRSYITSA
jgi:hypothetical protein